MIAPQPPGRTPQRSALRPGGETLMARGGTPGTPMSLPSQRSAREGGR